MEALREPTRAPADPAARVKVEALRLRLAHVKALADAGQYRPALIEVEEVVKEAQGLRYSPLDAEALYLLGSVLFRTEKLDRAEDTLYAALAAAEAGTHREILALSAMRLVALQAELGRTDAALRWVVYARGVIESSGGSPRLKAELEMQTGNAEQAGHHYAEAILALKRMLALEHEKGVTPLMMAQGNNLLGLVYQQLNRPREAVEHFKRSLAILEQVFGSGHPQRMAPLLNMAMTLEALDGPTGEAEAAVRTLSPSASPRRGRTRSSRSRRWSTWAARLLHTARGDYDKALPLLKRAVAGIARTRGPSSARAAEFLRCLASRPQLSQGDLGGALETFTQAAAVNEVVAPQGGEMGWDLLGMAQAQAQLGRKALALAHFDRALPILQQTYGADSNEYAAGLADEGEYQLQMGLVAKARATLRQALSIQTRVLDPGHPDIAQTRMKLGEAELEAKDYAAARESLEQAANRLEALHLAPELQAQARFALARALWVTGQDKARAYALATRAEAEYTRSHARHGAPASRRQGVAGGAVPSRAPAFPGPQEPIFLRPDATAPHPSLPGQARPPAQRRGRGRARAPPRGHLPGGPEGARPGDALSGGARLAPGHACAPARGGREGGARQGAPRGPLPRLCVRPGRAPRARAVL